jgi:hypothetical protein
MKSCSLYGHVRNIHRNTLKFTQTVVIKFFMKYPGVVGIFRFCFFQGQNVDHDAVLYYFILFHEKNKPGQRPVV